MAQGTSRIVIAERWSVLRRGLIGLLHGVHTVVDHFEDVRELRAVVERRPVDLVVLGDETGLDLASLVADVAAVDGGPPIVVLTDEIDGEGLRAVLRAGARSVLSKRVDDDALLDSIDRVLGGDRVIDQRFLPLLFGGEDLDATEAADDGPTLLTPRERDVLVSLARGFTNREIAQSLLLGESTVKTHLAHIYEKLAVDGRHHAVGRALELGLLH